MAISKINYGDTTLIDLTSDTVTAEKLAKGVTAHDASGAKITGTLENSGSSSSDVKFTTVRLPSTVIGGDTYMCYSTYLGRYLSYMDDGVSTTTISLPIGSVLILSHTDSYSLEELVRGYITPSSALWEDTFFDEMTMNKGIAIVTVVEGLTIE